jgi:phosphoribosylformylglycinamidine synthase
VDLKLESLFGNPPKTIMSDITTVSSFKKVEYEAGKLKEYIELVLSIEEVACKDWLTNKLTGR